MPRHLWDIKFECLLFTARIGIDMFKKVLIANRGEIAVRIIRACRDLGIRPVAVYSEADRTSLHVRMADEAYCIGPAPSSESYLSIDRIIETALRSGAQAVHPGYGFLSENPRFARACVRAGITLVGPTAEAMGMLGSKTGARSALMRSQVPLVPGTFRALSSLEEGLVEARTIGFPVMIKAAAGGGGKGMRLVQDESRFADDFCAASSEALRSFSDPSLYLEKYISRPRHVEIQILADHHGNALFLGERECSLQRRHQKVVEECPSPVVDENLRRRMGEAALKVVRALNYTNAGTVEFLLDDRGDFYFLEMNTRLQVEHPITEIVMGLDLVQEQFRIACGEPLSLRQEDVRMRGWAIECRIYAEDPDRNFLPAPGLIRGLQEPAGPGIRVDSGVYQGWEVPVHYDPLLAKLIAHGSDRRQAMARMNRALREYRVEGIKTNISFLLDILCDPDFIAARLSTHFLNDFIRIKANRTHVDAVALESMAVAAALAHANETAAMREPAGVKTSTWKMAGRHSRQWKQSGWKS